MVFGEEMGGTSSKAKHVPPAPPSKVLQLAGKQLTEIDASTITVAIDGLEELWLQDNQFVSLPDELGDATQSVLFYVSNNCLTSVPAWTSRWSQLEELNIR